MIATLCGHPDFRFQDSDQTRESIALLLVAMAVEDGNLDQREMDVVRGALEDAAVYEGAAIDFFLRRAFEMVQTDEEAYSQHLRDALDHFGDDNAARAILASMVLAVAMADGIDDDFEADFMSVLTEYLEISAERVEELKVTVVRPFVASLPTVAASEDEAAPEPEVAATEPEAE